MQNFNPVFIMPACHGREENIALVLESIARQTVTPPPVLIVDDGGQINLAACELDNPKLDVRVVYTPEKHQPGMEQPRNLGVSEAERFWPDATHAWFIDSDVILAPDAVVQLQIAYGLADLQRIMICPYEWTGPGGRPPEEGPWDDYLAGILNNDPRRYSFDTHPPEEMVTNDLSAGLACFSGNLVWPIEQFKRVGGYWSEIHHGRCEDGELGLRAVAMDVPISFAANVRGYHMHHEINHALIQERNARDVPMLNDRHPWIEQGGVFMVDRDGKVFDIKCYNCDKQIYTNQWWDHAKECGISTRLEIKWPPSQ